MLVYDLAAPLPNRLPANMPRKTAQAEPSVRAPTPLCEAWMVFQAPNFSLAGFGPL